MTTDIPDGTGPHHQVVELVAASLAAHDARDIRQRHATAGTVTRAHILTEAVCTALAEPDPARLRAELVQIDAVARAWIAAIDRRLLSEGAGRGH